MTRRTAAAWSLGLLLLLPTSLCGPAWGADGAATLLDTDWQLSSLGGTALQLAQGQRQPHLSLHEQDGRVSAWLGCNAAGGSYVLSGAQLSFGPLRSTRMACRQGMDLEHGLADALRNTTSWEITGQQLQLFDAAGAPLARFEPRPAP